MCAFAASYEQFASILFKSQKRLPDMNEIELPQITESGKTIFFDLEVSYLN